MYHSLFKQSSPDEHFPIPFVITNRVVKNRLVCMSSYIFARLSLREISRSGCWVKGLSVYVILFYIAKFPFIGIVPFFILTLDESAHFPIASPKE